MTDRPIAVVTGASRGIGRAIAIRLAGDYRIVALARDATRLDSLAATIAAAGGECRPVTVNLTRPDAIHRALHGLHADVLVNNAGVVIKRPFVDLTPDDWHTMVDVNFNALFHVTREVLPGMIAGRRGHIVNIASIAGRSAFVGGSCYAATKHAVLGFSECLMLETREHGVKVSVIMPGSVATDVIASGTDTSWMLKPEDVAETVAGVLATPAWALTYQVEVRAANPRPRTAS
jgi:3-oxoacyl-[acyl-carrier protein] reductase